VFCCTDKRVYDVARRAGRGIIAARVPLWRFV